MKQTLVVTRHPGAIEWLRRQGVDVSDVRAQLKPDDVTPGTVIIGVVPLSLAARAYCVHVIEFEGTAPRGQEYTADDMQAAGARLVTYVVHREAYEGASTLRSYRELVVSARPGAIEWLRRQGVDVSDVRATITAEDVTPGTVIIGNVPLWLAAMAEWVRTIEFERPPRGADLTADEMEAAGARLATYFVGRAPTLEGVGIWRDDPDHCGI